MKLRACGFKLKNKPKFRGKNISQLAMPKTSNTFLLFSSVLRANNYILDIFVQIIGLLTSSSKNKV
jgi:hypothetical protein